MLSHTGRKNGWQLAEMMGAAAPYGFQQFLYRAAWDPDAVRDDLRADVVQHLGDPQGLLVVAESGCRKQGAKSAGVQRQYSGTAGRRENCQSGVFLTYASPRGHTGLDRDRCRAAGIPDEVACATTPAQARAMRARALDAGVPAAWVTADSVYGEVKYLRVWLEARPLGSALAVSGKDTIVGADWQERRSSALLADLPTDGWARLGAGDGAKGPRWHDWLRLPLVAPRVAGWRRWVRRRRSVADPTAVTAYVCCCPDEPSLAALVRVAGTRWTVESGVAAAKQAVGLDANEVRSWTGWYRHITLACLAQAFLAVVRARGVDPLGEAEKGGAAHRRGASP